MGPTSAKDRVDETFPLRLRAARLKAGLSLEDLAQRLGGMVSRQAIAKYEKGLITPSPEVLEQLLQVLEIPPPPDLPEEVPESWEAKEKSFADQRPPRLYSRAFVSAPDFAFYLDKPPYITVSSRAERLRLDWQVGLPEEGVELRPEPRLTRKQTIALRVTLAEKMGKYLWLEKLLRMEISFHPPMETEIATPQDAEKAADKLRRLWDLGTGAVVNLLTFLEEKGIRTFKLEGPEKFESLAGVYRGRPFIAVRQDLPLDRLRFKTAAELAQVLFGFSYSPERGKLYNRFAAAFILPARMLEEYFLPVGRKIAFSELAEIKQRYGVSLQAIMYRAFDLGLVTERRLRSFREMMNEKGWLWKEPVEYRGEENPTRFRRLLHYAVSSEILGLETAASLAETTPEKLKQDMGEIF